MKRSTSPCFRESFILLIFTILPLFICAQVGIGTTSPNSQLDVNGALSLRTGPDLILANGTNNNISLGTTPYSFYRIVGPTASFNIGSVVPNSGSASDGQLVTFENNTSQTMRIVNNAGGTAINRILCPGGQDLILNGLYATVTLMYQTNHARWVITGNSQNTASSDSVSLATDIQISSATWANVPSMGTLTFTARKPSVLIMLSASGFAYTNSMAYVQLRVLNGATSIGGTNTKMQSYDDVTGTITVWSCNFTKTLTGLTVGTNYTLTVQGQVSGILGTYNAAIFPITNPDSHHLTISAIH
ncbi:hypothetical protein ATE92_1534 [Ulvibacter sp. MAR_2010_11]|uniref:hypothetical protein n=1 Tax=Ulvibacter sp. MAR_2010_11 TaxID=1250229 RepID=UPI000C2BC4A9|nr:hypothetical protein [Ulvibacter sp. MAR_2010_11]PKA83382.1 hypothetical protein ATE92_1534 [Ulvibacter sp. MAR_2010_11]